jgi:hypothetical protein
MRHHIRHRAPITDVEVHVIGLCDHQFHLLTPTRIIAQKFLGATVQSRDSDKFSKQKTPRIDSGYNAAGLSDGKG